MKKILAVLLAVMMMLSLSSVSFAADNSKNGNLQFDENGKFKILVFADVQDGYPMHEDFLVYMNEALDKCVDTLIRQIRKNKTRIERKVRESSFDAFAGEADVAEEIDFDLVCAYDVLMVRPISMHYYGNVLEIIIG